MYGDNIGHGRHDYCLFKDVPDVETLDSIPAIGPARGTAISLFFVLIF